MVFGGCWKDVGGADGVCAEGEGERGRGREREGGDDRKRREGAGVEALCFWVIGALTARGSSTRYQRYKMCCNWCILPPPHEMASYDLA